MTSDNRIFTSTWGESPTVDIASAVLKLRDHITECRREYPTPRLVVMTQAEFDAMTANETVQLNADIDPFCGITVEVVPDARAKSARIIELMHGSFFVPCVTNDPTE